MSVSYIAATTYLSVGYAALLDNSAQEKVNKLALPLWLAVVLIMISCSCQISELQDKIFEMKQEKADLQWTLEDVLGKPIKVHTYV